MVDQYQRAQNVMDFYKREYKKKYGEAPVFNRTKIKFLIIDIIKDITVAELERVITYYLQVEKEPDFIKMCYEYDSIILEQRQSVKDDALRQQLRKETRESVKKFREQFGGKE